MLVPQAAHQAAAGAGDLRGVERGEPLVLGGTRLDRAQFGEPRGGAELASATANAIEPAGLVAHADVPHVHARRETPLKPPHEFAKVHAIFGGEKTGELAAVPLPLGVADLEVELQFAGNLNGRLTHSVLVGAEAYGAIHFLRRREAHNQRQLVRRCLAVRGARLALLGELAGAVHASQVLAPIYGDDDSGLERGRGLAAPLVEDATIALELDLDQVGRDSGGGHSVNAPILRYFSRRRRTSLSGLRPRNSSMFRASASCTACAVVA